MSWVPHQKRPRDRYDRLNYKTVRQSLQSSDAIGGIIEATTEHYTPSTYIKTCARDCMTLIDLDFILKRAVDDAVPGASECLIGWVPVFNDSSALDAWESALSTPEDEGPIPDPPKRTHEEVQRAYVNRHRKNIITRLIHRDGYQCNHCGTDDGTLCIDHVHPISKGGCSDLENLQLLCGQCNSRKGNRVGKITKEESLA